MAQPPKRNPRAAAFPEQSRRTSSEDSGPTTFYDTDSANDGDRTEIHEYKPAFLYVEQGPGVGQLIPVQQGTLVIGRASISELRLQHSSISRRHAQVIRAAERFYIRDLGSQNGTFVNRVRIATEIELFAGDVIALGTAVLRLRGAATADSDPRVAAVAAPRKRRRTGVSRNLGLLAMLLAAVGLGLGGVILFANSKKEAPVVAQAPKPVVAPGEPAAPKKSAEKKDPVADEKKAEKSASSESKTATAEKKKASTKAAESGAEAPTPTKAVVAKADPEPSVVRPVINEEQKARVLKKFEAGALAEALSIAQESGLTDLASKLSRFQSAYEAANNAMAKRDGVAALKSFTTASRIDSELSKGWSKYSTEINSQLSRLYYLIGQKHLEASNQSAAKQAFTAALKYDPDNAQASVELSKFGDSGGGAAAAPAAPRAEPKPKPATEKPKEKQPSEIDAAFGD